MKLNLKDAGILREPLRAAWQGVVNFLKVPKTDVTIKVTVRPKTADDDPEIGGLFSPHKGELLVLISPNDTIEHLVEVVAHELVHARQFASGELIDLGIVAAWKGKLIVPKFSRDDRSEAAYLAYRALPWEAEAHDLQEPLRDVILRAYARSINGG